MADHIHYMHNNTDVKLRVEKRNNGGQYSKIAEIPKDDNDGPFDHIPLTDLRFVVKSQKPVYFRIIDGGHSSGPKPHKDGETGHPGEG